MFHFTFQPMDVFDLLIIGCSHFLLSKRSLSFNIVMITLTSTSACIVELAQALALLNLPLYYLKFAADENYKYWCLFQKPNKTWYFVWIICQQMIHTKYQVLFSLKITNDVLNLSSAEITIGTGTKIIEARTVENLFCEVVLVYTAKQQYVQNLSDIVRV